MRKRDGMTRFIAYGVLALAWTAVAPAWAQPVLAQNDMRGHWTGSLETPAGPLAIEVDLDKSASGWVGSVSIPAQGANGLPLDAISFTDGKASFHFKGLPGDPTFAGALSSDGKSLEGTFSQGPVMLPLKLTLAGDPKVELPKANPAVAQQFVGNWEGTIPAGPGLRVILTIANGKDGAEATMVSVDQGNAQIPVAGIAQNGAKLSLDLKAVGGGYEAEISGDGAQLNGTFTQAGNSFPLQLKKSAK